MSTEAKNYRDLIVWQKAMDHCTAVYEATRLFPKDELFGLTQQLRKAVVSVPSNIAEGNGRGSTADYVRFLGYSRGSLFESQTQLEVGRRLGYIAENVTQPISDLSNEIERMLNSMISKLEQRI
jgi:four helix bundle protein